MKFGSQRWVLDELASEASERGRQDDGKLMTAKKLVEEIVVKHVKRRIAKRERALKADTADKASSPKKESRSRRRPRKAG
jgi:hypothetical protein